MTKCDYLACNRTEGVTTVETALGPTDLCPSCRRVALELFAELAAAMPFKNDDEIDHLVEQVYERLAMEGVVEVSVTPGGTLVFVH
ncbi:MULTISPECIES: hypothetical protein [unclassified Parafrankia]|uniref:hypothetical protein n=1 Tax=unclassified Parafrankia TaxID=2994368 RepID=UPI000DA442D8|nr:MULTISPECIES: hypothetical protein [unclassified Parafrankia]TCJ40072.1 hypothetical protein E0504_06680 [Parafrankia sp. BMG5.11]SQD94549.1 conserved hypothetical protein [Parafrankia sp. Ea1.12]